MNTTSWLQVLLLGGLAGAIGQGARVAVGLKKASDAAADEGLALHDVFEASRLVVSLIIGFIAGALAGIAVLGSGDATVAVDAATILGLAAAGYAGTDFIEGVLTRVSGTSAGSGVQGVPPAGPQGTQQIPETPGNLGTTPTGSAGPGPVG